jgi:hypothetical protein
VRVDREWHLGDLPEAPPNGPSPEAALEATLEPTKRKPNRLMTEADTAIGPREHKTRKCLPRT